MDLWADTTEGVEANTAERNRQYAISSVASLEPFIAAASTRQGMEDRLSLSETQIREASQGGSAEIVTEHLRSVWVSAQAQRESDRAALVITTMASSPKIGRNERVLWKADSSDYMQVENFIPEVEMNSAVGKRVRLVMFNDAGVAAEHDIGQILKVNMDGTFEWRSEAGTHDHPIAMTDVHTLAQIEQEAPQPEMLFASKTAAAGDNQNERTCTNQRCLDYGSRVEPSHEHHILGKDASKGDGFSVEKRGDKWVVTDTNGNVKGTHDSEEAAEKQKNAAYANWAKGKTSASNNPLCPTCFEKQHGSEPDMGDDVTWEDGKCSSCGTEKGLVFKESSKTGSDAHHKYFMERADAGASADELDWLDALNDFDDIDRLRKINPYAQEGGEKKAAAWTHESPGHAYDHGSSVAQRQRMGEYIDPGEMGSVNFPSDWQAGVESQTRDILSGGHVFASRSEVNEAFLREAATFPTSLEGGNFEGSEPRPARTSRPRVQPPTAPETTYVAPTRDKQQPAFDEPEVSGGIGGERDDTRAPETFGEPTEVQRAAAKIAKISESIRRDNPHLGDDQVAFLANKVVSHHPVIGGSAQR